MASVALCLFSFNAHAQSAPTGVVVPSYFNATKNVGSWDSLANTAAKVPTTAILNPDSGPGVQQDPNYAAAITKLQAAGGKAIGYVYTSYTERPLSDVIADINAYIAMYKLNGFFIDEMTADSNTAHVLYYQSIYNTIKSLNANYSVTANPGTNIPEIYMTLQTADRFVVFENNSNNYAKYQPSSWQSAYPSSRFVHIVTKVSATQLPDVVKYAKSHGAGAVFITSLGGTNPYKALPTYWSDEISDLSGQ